MTILQQITQMLLKEQWKPSITKQISSPTFQGLGTTMKILLIARYEFFCMDITELPLIKPNQDIDILGVFHGALDISRYLF